MNEHSSQTTLGAAPSYEVISFPKDAGPKYRKIAGYYNDYNQARSEGDLETLARLDQIVPQLLDDYERTESKNVGNPAWKRRVVRAGWHCATGEYELALEYELEGWRFADAGRMGTDSPQDVVKRKSISASNIADELRRLGRYDEAVAWARKSCELWMANPINHLILALALYKRGHREEANQILQELLGVVDLQSGRDPLAFCLAFERELRAMDDLQAVRQLLSALGSFKN